MQIIACQPTTGIAASSLMALPTSDSSVVARLVNLANGVAHGRLGHSQEVCVPGGIMDIGRTEFLLARVKISSLINRRQNGDFRGAHASWPKP